VPIYLLKERYGYFILYFIYTLLGSLFLEMMIAYLTFLVMGGAKMSNMSPASVDIFFLLTALLMVVFFGVAIKLILHGRQSREDYQKLERERVEAELKFLKAQLNPHFLFNTLNNLYFLSNEKSERAPKAILALSEILDYVLRASEKTLVSLAEEIKQVENYIALELLRYEERVQIKANFSGDISMQRIAPMILMTLVENAFKHGVMPTMEKSWINISVHAGDGVAVVVSNSVKNEKDGNKIGLENLKSQLLHLYKKNYDLQIVNDKSEFTVRLTLKNEV
jgi:hypothetical protein